MPRFSLNTCVLLAVGAIAVTAGTAVARDIYVDGRTGSNNGNGSYNSPLATIWAANNIVQPCDTVHVAPSTVYSRQGVQYVHGTPSCPIRFVGGSASGALTQIQSTDANQPPFALYGVSYIEISGFQFLGRADASDCLRASSPNASNINHHITISRNVFSYCGEDGIDFFQSDYLTISHNTIYRTSGYTRWGIFGSGISLLGSWNTDNSTGPKIFIDSNLVWGVSNTPDCGQGDSACFGRSVDSDGSGIIIDSTCINYRYGAGGDPNGIQPCYTGRTVISNNVVAGNGGRGIYVYHSSHVTIANNTAYGNNVDPYEGENEPGELEANESGDVLFYNNLSVSLGGISRNGYGWRRHCISFEGNSGTERPSNSAPGYFNPNQAGAGAGALWARNNWCYFMNDIGSSRNYINYFTAGSSIQDAGYGNPLIARLASDGSGDFRPRAGSPVLNRTDLSLFYLSSDFLYASRQPRSALGAYSNTAQ